MREHSATSRRRIATVALASLLGAGPAGLAPALADACPDALITAGVKARLAVDDIVGAFKINVETDECVVTLNGCVDTRAQIKRSRALAGKVAKVKSVKSRLTICPAKETDE
jgi:osmotically-inducible protein OsmY